VRGARSRGTAQRCSTTASSTPRPATRTMWRSRVSEQRPRLRRRVEREPRVDHVVDPVLRDHGARVGNRDFSDGRAVRLAQLDDQRAVVVEEHDVVGVERREPCAGAPEVIGRFLVLVLRDDGDRTAARRQMDAGGAIRHRKFREPARRQRADAERAGGRDERVAAERFEEGFRSGRRQQQRGEHGAERAGACTAAPIEGEEAGARHREHGGGRPRARGLMKTDGVESGGEEAEPREQRAGRERGAGGSRGRRRALAPVRVRNPTRRGSTSPERACGAPDTPQRCARRAAAAATTPPSTRTRRRGARTRSRAPRRCRCGPHAAARAAWDRPAGVSARGLATRRRPRGTAQRGSAR